MKKLFCLLMIFVMLLSLFTGCRGSEKPYEPTGDALGDTNDITKEDEQEPQALTLTYYKELSINPLSCNDYTNRAIFSLMYQSLFSVSREYKIEPVLCKNYRISPDMKSYTFYVESAVFSNGATLTAADVAATLQAARQSKIYSGRFRHIDDISLTEDGGVRIQLNTPMENLPLLLDIPILLAADVENPRPAGTGPYVLDETGHTSYLRRRSDWWCQSDLVVTADAITLLQAESNPKIRDEFQFGQLNLVCADPGSDKFADYRSDFELWNCENGMFLFLACSMDSEVFSNSEVRTALTHAVDRETITETHYRGYAQGVTLPASPHFPYYSQSLADKYGFDSAKFTAALESAGMVGKEISFVVNSDDSLRVRVARSIAQMLTDCGLVVNLRELSTSQYLATIKVRNFDLYLGQTILSPNMDLSEFFHEYGDLSFGGINDTGAYSLCLDALANYGNYYSLYKYVMEHGLLCPVLFRSYAIFGTRGLITDLTPARDNVFYYSIGKNMEQAILREPETTDNGQLTVDN